MSYGRILTPRFYIDTPNWRISRAFDPDNWSLIAGTLNSGSLKTDLLDMKPLHRCSFDTSANTTTHIILQWDTRVTSTANKWDYVAILNHNLHSADGRIRLAYKATAFTGAGEGTTVSGLTSVVNGTVDTNVSDPPADGSTINTFNEVTASDGRYWAIEIEDDSSFSGTDLEIGSILMGESYTMPHSPDLSVKRSIHYDGVKVLKSAGGGEYANATHIGGDDFINSSFGQPFRNKSVTGRRRAGSRMQYDMNFSYLNDSDIMPSDMAAPYSDTVFHDVWGKTSGMYVPFIFTPDSTSTTMGDYMFARFAKSSMDMTQVANNIWNVGMSVVETW